ncbi:MAG: sulfatase-like hydrolase/transferase [Cyclobacteriaceae bacterium]
MSKYILTILFISISFATTAEAKKDKSKPNILFIFADDLGYGDLGCYGHPYMETPNIDHLAEEGTKFMRFYATGVTCSPSRTGFMTSRHPASYEKYMPFHDFAGRQTITELLAKNGYFTGHVGKWHISGNKKPPNGTYGIQDLRVIGDSRDKTVGKDDDVFDAAIDFVEKNQDKPFYLNVWGHISHYRVDPHEKFPEHFSNLTIDKNDFGVHYNEKIERSAGLVPDINTAVRNYLGEVWSLDLAVGRLLKRLDELGLKDNTIVVFSSDQGPAPNKREVNADHDSTLTANMMGSAGILRGGKHEQFEGGVRIPFIVRYPGKILANKTNYNSILSGLDWLPTLCEITNSPYDKTSIEGLDVSDVWFGSDRKPERYLYWKTSSVKAAVSILHNNWKGHEERKSKTFKLYDLSESELELEDVSQKYPQIVADLRSKADAWKSTLPDEYIKGVKKKKDKEEKEEKKKNKKKK